MPIYQYQGQQYNISTDDPAEAKSKILSYLEKGSREKSTAIGDIAAGLNSAVNTMGQGVIYSGASLAGALGADETSQNLFNVYNKYDKQFDEAESKVDRGEGGKVLKAIGQIPAYLNPITAGMMIGGGGIKTGTDIINEGGSEDAAKKAQAFDMASSTAMYALGPLTNIPGRVANAGLQAGINVAQEAGMNRPVQNMIRENADLRRLPDMTIGDYGAAAVPGAVFGALSPKKGKPGETPLPDDTPSVDVDKAYVARKEATLHSIEKQVLMLENQIASIKPRDDGTYSEKQMKFIQSLEEQKQGKIEEATRIQKNIAAYSEPDQAAKIASLSTEDLIGKVGSDTTPIEDQFVGDTSPETMYKRLATKQNIDSLFTEYKKFLDSTTDGGFGKVLDIQNLSPEEIASQIESLSSKSMSMREGMSSKQQETLARMGANLSKAFFNRYGKHVDEFVNTPTTTNKQKGSWTPFADMDDGRPDDSNAPGILRPQTEKKRFGFKKFTEEQPQEDFRNPRHKQPPPPLDEGLTMTEWAVKDDGIDPFGEPPKDSRELAIYNQKRVELERAGIMETPVGDESDVRHRQRGFKTRESANNYVKMLEGQVESQRKAVKKLEENLHTPIGSEIALENAKIRLSEMETRLGRYRSKDMGWKEDKVSKPQITEIFSLDDDANKTPEQVKQDRIDAGLDPLPQPPRGPGFKQRGSINLFLSNEKAKETDTAAIASRLKNQQFDKVVDVTNLRSSDEMLAEMGNGQVKDYGGFLTKGERAMFGFQQFVEAVKRKAPLVWEQAKRIRQAESGEVEAKRLIWHGSNTGTGFQGLGPFTKLKHSQNPDSMETLLPNLSKNDKIVLTEFLVKNSEERIRHDKADMSGLTDFQKKAVGIIQKFYDQVHSLGGTRYRNGYIHALRDGDFAVGIKTSKGDLFHVEPAKTKELAAKMQKFLKEKGYETTDIIDFKAEEGNPLGDSFSTVKDVLESLKDRLPDTESGAALRALDDVQQFIADHATPGRHNVRASLYTGFKGTSLIKGRAANAEDFFNGFKNYLDEVAAQTKKNKLTEETTKFWETDAGRKLKEEFPNQYDTAMYLTDVSMNKNQTYEPVKAFDEKARSVINTLTEKAMKKFGKNTDPFYYPEVPVLDRGIGLAAQLFYIRTLTSRPAFWAGQILSSPFATRQFLKEGTVLDTLVAQGKAWGTIMSGGDKDFKNFFNEIRQSSDTIRPQFIVDINRVPLFEDIKHPTLNKIFMWGTGQEQAGIADATSRYFTLAMAYHFYKDQGLTGSKLKENATHMAELTMQMYNRANSPPVLNKLGILGQNIAPLQKFGLGQLENLIGDIRYMMDQPGFAQKIRGALPALSTLMVTTIMGGSMGISLLTEYEVLRYLLVKAGSAIGEDWSELFPSALENMMKHQNWFQMGVQKGYEGLGASEEFAKDASTHGLPSAATGFDIGSSLRFNPYVGEGLIKQNYSPIDNFPLVKQMIDMAVTTSVKARKVLGGDVDEAEDRKADLSTQVFTGQNYLIDKFKHKSDTRAFVPGGGRLYGQVPQTQKEQIGQIIGSPSLETAKARKTAELMDRKEKQIAQKRQDAIDLLADAVTEGNQKGIDRAIELALKAEMDHKQIMQGLKAAMAQRNKSRLDAMTTNQKGFPSSKEQKRKYMERLQYE